MNEDTEEEYADAMARLSEEETRTQADCDALVRSTLSLLSVVTHGEAHNRILRAALCAAWEEGHAAVQSVHHVDYKPNPYEDK